MAAFKAQPLISLHQAMLPLTKKCYGEIYMTLSKEKNIESCTNTFKR